MELSNSVKNKNVVIDKIFIFIDNFCLLSISISCVTSEAKKASGSLTECIHTFISYIQEFRVLVTIIMTDNF